MDFETIYNTYFKDVYCFLLSLCHDEKIAEEITQDTFFKAMQSIDKFKGNCKIKVWLCQIAKNAYFLYTKRQKRIVDIDITTIESESQIEYMLGEKEHALEIHKILHNLPEPYKEVFSLRVFGELSFLQISNLFEKTENWARVTFHRAKLKIYEQVKEVDKNE